MYDYGPSLILLKAKNPRSAFFVFEPLLIQPLGTNLFLNLSFSSIYQCTSRINEERGSVLLFQNCCHLVFVNEFKVVLSLTFHWASAHWVLYGAGSDSGALPIVERSHHREPKFHDVMAWFHAYKLLFPIVTAFSTLFCFAVYGNISNRTEGGMDWRTRIGGCEQDGKYVGRSRAIQCDIIRTSYVPPLCRLIIAFIYLRSHMKLVKKATSGRLQRIVEVKCWRREIEKIYLECVKIIQTKSFQSGNSNRFLCTIFRSFEKRLLSFFEMPVSAIFSLLFLLTVMATGLVFIQSVVVLHKVATTSVVLSKNMIYRSGRFSIRIGHLERVLWDACPWDKTT